MLGNKPLSVAYLIEVENNKVEYYAGTIYNVSCHGGQHNDTLNMKLS